MTTDKRYDEPDPVRWFNALGTCNRCGKPAQGKLMGPRNESYGNYCTRCAEKRLIKAEELRKRFYAQATLQENEE